MRLLFSIWFSVLFQYLSAQQWEWTKSFGSTASSNHLNAEHIAAWGDSGMVVTGNYNGTTLEIGGFALPPSSNTRAFVSAMDSKGDAIWNFTFGDDNSTEVVGTTTDASGNVYVAGNFQGIIWIANEDTLFNKGASDGYLLKLLPTGAVEWAVSISTALSDNVKGISTDGNGNIYLTGYTDDYGVDPVVSYGFIIKVSPEGQILWYKAGTSVLGSIGCESIVTDAEGNSWIAGSTRGDVLFENQYVIPAPDSITSAFIVQYSSEGKFVRGKSEQNIQGGYLRLALHQDMLTITGAHYIDDSTGSYYTLRTIQLDTLLNRNWTHTAEILPDIEQTIMPYGIACDSMGNTFITGLFNGSWKLGDSITLINVPVSTGGGYTNAFLLKLDKNGLAQYAHSLGDTLMDQGKAIARLNNGQLAIAGMQMSDTMRFGHLAAVNPSELQVWGTHGITFYYRNTYSYVTVFSDEKINTLVRDLQTKALVLAYPNPTNNTLYLQSDAFTGQPVQVQIFSADGRLVRQQNISGATPTIQVQTGDLPPGMYIATIIVNQQISSAKFVKQ